MKNIFAKGNPFRYDVWKLVNRKLFASQEELCHPVQMISDIDKTYLESTYDSFRAMAKLALEDATEKITVRGAREFFRTVKWHENSPLTYEGVSVPLHFVSSSPPQLRTVLEHKMGLDRLFCASNCFKDQVYNLTRGKISLLRHQVPYKLAALLSLVATFQNPKTILLLGDDAESDPYVYVLVKHFLLGYITPQNLIDCLSELGVPDQMSKDIFAHPLLAERFLFKDGESSIKDIHIFIRSLKKTTIAPLEEGSHPYHMNTHHSQNIPRQNIPQGRRQGLSNISQNICWFSEYTDLALVFHHLNLLSEQGLSQFAKSYDQRRAMGRKELLSSWLTFQKVLSKTQQSPKTPYSFMAPWLKECSLERKQTLIKHKEMTDNLEDLMIQPYNLRGHDCVENFKEWLSNRSVMVQEKHLTVQK
ncbi:MAG: hypothetical protein OXC44_02190 [Proteobacteria bacterium]|nr:hypothetical protein [Pseudomonadota bacterium]